MKAIVLGAGIVGITTAYELNREGHDVTVIDREALPASFTSYGNAGLFAPAHSYAWSSPAAPKILMKSLWRNDQALRFRPNLDPAFWSWMWRFWNQCTAEKAALNTTRKVRLSNYSQQVFHETLARTPIKFDGRQDGLLYFYRNKSVFETAAAKSEILQKNGCPIETLDVAGVIAKEPALEHVKGEIAGGLFAKNDESGDCRLFARNMGEWLKQQGVKFQFGTTIQGFDIEGDRIAGVITDKGKVMGDIYVLSLGIYSPHIARQLGVDLPIYPVKGYSITVPIGGRNNPPRIGGVDEENLTAYCPMGDRMRVTATAEFAGYSNAHKPEDFRHMLKVIKTLFPDGADYSKIEYWAGLRPMTPEGTPILGQGRHKNLWYNTGQGHMGWTMSHAGARITADLVAGRKPGIPLDGMTLDRAA